MREDCTFYWYWWNYSLSLFKFSFHNRYIWWQSVCSLWLPNILLIRVPLRQCSLPYIPFVCKLETRCASKLIGWYLCGRGRTLLIMRSRSPWHSKSTIVFFNLRLLHSLFTKLSVSFVGEEDTGKPVYRR